MMVYRDVVDAIADLLDLQSSGRFRVLGRLRQTKDAKEFQNDNRLVNVYYSQGDFPKTGRKHGPKTHDLTINIDFTVSASAHGNMSILDSETSSAAEKMAAIAAIKDATEVADKAIDEIISAVYWILMDAQNEEIGFDVGKIANRWIDTITKDTLPEKGDLIVKTASMKYTCRVQETVPGAKGVIPDSIIIDSEIPAGDTVGAGIENEN